MPAPLLIPLIAAGASLLGTGINAWTQNRANRKNIAAQENINAQNVQFQRDTNALNRQWSLEDWQRNVAYNDPAQVMQRLREAGLNTQFAGGASAITPAPSIHTTATPPQAQRMPPINPVQISDPGNIVNTFMSAQIGALDVQNKKAQNNLLQDQSELNKLNMSRLLINNARSRFDLGLAQELKDTTIESAILRNRATLASTAESSARLGLIGAQVTESQARTGKIQTETGLMIPEFRLKQVAQQVQNARTQAETKVALANLTRLQIENMNLPDFQKNKLNQEAITLKLMEYDETLRQIGLNPNSSDYFTAISRYLVQLGNNVISGFTR